MRILVLMTSISLIICVFNMWVTPVTLTTTSFSQQVARITRTGEGARHVIASMLALCEASICTFIDVVARVSVARQIVAVATRAVIRAGVVMTLLPTPATVSHALIEVCKQEDYICGVITGAGVVSFQGQVWWNDLYRCGEITSTCVVYWLLKV